MLPELAKYTRVEYERRFLVPPDADWRGCLEPYSKSFADKYLQHTQLRLRVLVDSDSGRQVFKLTKKFPSSSPYFRTIGSVVLTAEEHRIFDQLPGDRLRKMRHYHTHEGRLYSVDVFEGPLEGLVLSEVEASGLEELMSIEPPPYSHAEVTEQPFFTGGALCQTSRCELLHELSRHGVASSSTRG